jgi:hypothetical protein
MPGTNSPPPAAAGKQRASGLTESPDDSRGPGLLNSASRDGDPSLDECISRIARLSEALEARNRSTKPDLEQDIAVFTSMKDLQAEIETALWLDRDAPALWDLRDALRPFLLRLATDLAKPDRHDKTAEDLMQSLDQDDVHTLCNGLAVCASSTGRLAVVQELLKAGAKLDQASENGDQRMVLVIAGSGEEKRAGTTRRYEGPQSTHACGTKKQA